MFKEENIRKKSNLIENDSISCYLDYCCQQNHHTFNAFYQLLNQVKPKRILEIGTALGGLTRFLNNVSKELGLDIEIRSYDIYGRQGYNQIIEEGVDLRIENIFSDDFSQLKDYGVVEFIQQDGVTLVLCDGGDKIKEFNLLSQFLKVNDIIMAHDYAIDNETFQNIIDRVFWNWHEISEFDIHDVIKIYNLEPCMQDLFDKCVWVCKVKS